jgi:signal transduction histidine kinase/DNA-binding response OmpR family regulator
MKFWNQHLTTKVASAFLLLSLTTVAVVGGVTFFQAREALKQAAFNQLSVTASLKEEEITRWFEDQQRDFLLTTQFPEFQDQFKILLNADAVDAKARSAHSELSGFLQRVVNLKPGLRELFILDRSNRILLSTDRQRQGQYEILANVTYFEQIKPGDTFAPIFYVSPVTGKPSVTLATSLRNATGVRQGAILAHLNLDRIDQIVRERTGLGETGETYLVGSLVSQNTFIAREPSKTQVSPDGISSQGIDAAMSGISGSGLYRNYAGVPVIGVYRWLNERDMALLVEMQQAEAFAPARRLAGIIVYVGLVAVGVLSTGVYWLSRQLELSRQQLERSSHQLEQKAQEAEAANRAKSLFLANMSHELRTPLNAILGFVQVMERDPQLTPPQHESLDIINRSGEHLLNLINDVLEMSKIEAGRVMVNPTPFDLHRFLRTMQEMFRVRAESKQLYLRVDRAAGLPQTVVTDEVKLRQILFNLLSNAIKFTEVGGVTLRVSYYCPTITEHRLEFAVQDTGRGIAPEEQHTLFQPFVQTSSGLSTQEGTGLGLAISRQFVRLLGGEIHVTSRVNQGSTFWFDVKVDLTDGVTAEPLAPVSSVLKLAPNQPTYRILVVDDKPENRQPLVALLSLVGFETQEAANGEEAIARWASWHPHLIWMDMRMPVMDGYTATQQIKAHSDCQPTVVIALTASVFEEEQIGILAAGCDDLVRKPFKAQVIFEKIAKHLGARYLYADNRSSSSSPAPAIPPQGYVLTTESLTAMSGQWLAQLHQAAIQVDADLILQLVEQIPTAHQALTEALTELVEQFDFDAIVDLTQTALQQVADESE